MSKLTGRKVKIVDANNKDWPLNPILVDSIGYIQKILGVDYAGPFVKVHIVGLVGVECIEFFPDELRYMNNKKVVL